MYIDKLYDMNVGPIERVCVDFPFNNDGTPKPIVFVGENGSGKSTLLSNIVDSFFTLASEHYDNVLQSNDNFGGHQYYKAISPIEIRTGSNYMYSYLSFKDTSPLYYVFKSGRISISEFKKQIPHGELLGFSWDEQGNYKMVQDSDQIAKNAFEKNAICYFGPDRYEKPMWLGDKYYNDELVHPSVHTNWARKLKNLISVKNVQILIYNGYLM